MSKEFQIRDGNLIASFDLENEDGDIDFCKLLKVSHGVVNEIGMFVDYIATNKIIKDQSKQIADLQSQFAEKEKEIEYQENMKILAVDNQNKKAIEQLEKVKEWCENHKFSDEYDYIIAYEEDEEDASGCEDYFKDYIDNQIKQLKEMSNEK